MLKKGDEAPNFTLPGFAGDSIKTFSLDEGIGQDHAVLLLFFPFDFSPVCTDELCAIRDAEWFQLTSDLDVWAISGDSAFAHKAFADEFDLTFPLLSDSNGNVADAYDVCYDEWEDHERVPKRAVFLIDSDNEIRYVWKTDDALEKPDFFPVKKALDELVRKRDDFSSENIDISIEYEDDSAKSVRGDAPN